MVFQAFKRRTLSANSLAARPSVAKALLSSVIGLAMASLAPAAQAQQREIINPSFEDGPNPAQFSIHPDALHPGWISTNGEMETWADGFLGKNSQQGNYHVELNPSQPVGLYQEICLINGEQLNWDFYHAARGFSNGTDTIVYEVLDSNGALIQTLTSNSLPRLGPSNTNNSNNLWDNVVGTTTYTGPSGVQRLQFRSTNGGSNGNFLDNINIEIVPLIVFDNLTTSNLEGDSSDLPFFVISGIVPTTFDIVYNITGGTATQGVDYTVQSNTVTVPAGTYDGTSAASNFILPMTVLTDALTEGDETIEFTYDPSGLGTTAVSGGPNCTDVVTTAVHTIHDGTPSLELVKSTPVNADEDGSGSVSIGDTLTYTVTATNDGDVTQTDVVVSDPMLTGDSTTTCSTLAVGASCVLTGDYVVLVSDADGDIVNTASVESDEVTAPVEATVTTPVVPAAPSLSMTKTADNPGPHKAGDVITYTYTVTNEGNTAVNDVAVNDTHNGSNPAPTPLGETLLTDAAPASDSVDATPNNGTWDILAPGDVVTFTGTYTVTQNDVDNL